VISKTVTLKQMVSKKLKKKILGIEVVQMNMMMNMDLKKTKVNLINLMEIKIQIQSAQKTEIKLKKQLITVKLSFKILRKALVKD
jgi:hypothetical protein